MLNLKTSLLCPVLLVSTLNNGLCKCGPTQGFGAVQKAHLKKQNKKSANYLNERLEFIIYVYKGEI